MLALAVNAAGIRALVVVASVLAVAIVVRTATLGERVGV